MKEEAEEKKGLLVRVALAVFAGMVIAFAIMVAGIAIVIKLEEDGIIPF